MGKKKIYLVWIILVLLAMIMGSYAYFSWRTSESRLVLTVGDINNIQVTLKPYRINAEMVPVSTYESESYVNVDVVNSSNKSKGFELYYSVNTIDQELRSNDFKYTITKSTDGGNTYSEVKTGNFSEAVDNTNIIIYNATVSSKTTEKYRVYVWLSNNGDQSNVSGASFNAELRAEFDSSSNIVVDVPDGLIPVVFDTSNGTVVKTVSSTDASWYDYNSQEWANAVLVKSSGTQTRNYYSTNNGVVVNQSDILAYYTYIPRYSYRIPTRISCSAIVNPTFDTQPACYKYVMSDSDKTTLIQSWLQYVRDYEDTSYTLGQSEVDINKCLANENGGGNCAFNDSYNMTDVLNFVFDANETEVSYTTELVSERVITPTGAKSIDIKFESKDAVKSTGDAVNEYLTHPAFNFGGTELNGIWVGKFETTGTADEPTVLPDVTSLTTQSTSNQLKTSLKFAGGNLSSNGSISFSGNSTYGLTTNTNSHMMKNREWGAVAYLSHSKYGTNKEIYINNSSLHYTGRSGGNVGGNTSVKEVYTNQTSTELYNEYGYYTWDGFLLNYNTNTKSTTRNIAKVASTTGNITGIYDMVGGTNEYVMGVFANSSGQLWSGNSTSWNSGFTGLMGESGESHTGTAFPDSKYYDVYKASSGITIDGLTACNGGVCYGHALSETSWWYNDGYSIVSASQPWSVRGGNFDWGVGAGIFSIGGLGGDPGGNYGFRSVIVYDPPGKVTVSFDSNGGSSCAGGTYDAGVAYGSLCTPSKGGYSFFGWFNKNVYNEYTLSNGMMENDSHIFGPNISLNAGKYVAEITGSNLSGLSFDIYSSAETSEIPYDSIAITDTKVLIYFTLSKTVNPIEIRTIKNGSTFTFNSLKIYSATTSDSIVPTGSHTLTAEYIDTNPPTGTISVTYNDGILKGTVSATDIGSGVSSYMYALTTNSTCPTSGYIESTNNNYSFTITSVGTYYICAKVKDRAGNISEPIMSSSYILGSPVIAFGNNGNSGYVNGNISSTIIVSRGGAELNTSTYKYIYSTNSSAIPNTSFTSGNSYTLTDATGTYYLIAKACDVNGECSTKVSNPFYVDNIAPTCSLSVSGTTITGTYSDTGGSEVAYYGWNSSMTGTSSATKTIDSTGTHTFYVKDGAGNPKSCSLSVVATTSGTECSSWGNYYCTSWGKYYCKSSTGNACGNQACCSREGGTWTRDCNKYGRDCNQYTTTYSCSSGYTKINNSYCYKIN